MIYDWSKIHRDKNASGSMDMTNEFIHIYNRRRVAADYVQESVQLYTCWAWSMDVRS